MHFRKMMDPRSASLLKKITGAHSDNDELIALLPGYVCWLNTKSEFLGCNNRLATAAGLASRHDIVGKTNKDMPWKEQAEELDHINQLIIKSRKQYIHEEYLLTAHGPSIYLSHKIPLLDEQDNTAGILCVSLDLSKTKKRELELREAKTLAEAAIQNPAKCLARMRRDIHTPLSSIIGFAGLLKTESNDPGIREYADNLMASGNVLLGLMAEFMETMEVSLNHTHLGHTPILSKKFNLMHLFEQVIALCLAKAQDKKMTLSLHLDSKLPRYVLGDSNRLQRIALDLAIHTLKATDMGHVSVNVQLAKKSYRDLVIKLLVTGSAMSIPINKQQEMLAQSRPLTAHELPGVKRGVDELGGEIYIAQEPHQITCCTCLIPLQEALLDEASGIGINTAELRMDKAHTPPAPARKQANADTGTATKVLMVEDNIIAQSMGKAILTAMGCQVDVASNGDEALALCQASRYEMILMDIGLGAGDDGYEVTHHIRSQLGEKGYIPIIALTAHAGEENKQRCIEAGMNAVITKPLTQTQAANLLKTFVPSRKMNAIPVTKEARRDLPDTDNELFQIDQFALFDVDQGLKNCGDRAMLVELLALMATKEIPTDLQRLKNAFENQDYHLVETLAHKIKGGAMYVGTTRMKYACQYVERYWKTGRQAMFDELYNQAISTIEETQKYITNWLIREG